MLGQYLYVPLDKAQTVKEGHVYVNRWWSVHPDKGVVFYTRFLRLRIEGEDNEPSPQCNQDEYTARHLNERLRPDCGVIFIPAVYAAHAWDELVHLVELKKVNS